MPPKKIYSPPNNWTVESEFEQDVWQLKFLVTSTHLHENRRLNFLKISPVWLRTALKAWLRFCLSREAVNTILSKFYCLKDFSQFLESHSPGLLPRDINRQLVLDYLSHLSRHHSSADGKAHYIVRFKDFLENCVRFGWLDITQEPLIFPEDFPKVPKNLPRYIPDDILSQVNQKIELLPEPMARMLLVIQECGLRVSELINLKLDCLRQNTVGTWWLTYYQFKMKKEHIIPISHELAAVIQKQQQYIKENLSPKFSYLFCTFSKYSYFGHWSKKGSVGKSIQERCQKLLLCQSFTPRLQPMRDRDFSGYLHVLAIVLEIRDISGNIFPLGKTHAFRHTVGTSMANRGVPQHIIQRFLGHSSPEMTSVYCHIHDETLQREIERFQDNHKVVNIAGQVVESNHPELDRSELQWFKRSVLAQALPNGSCARPILRGPCPHANACLTCGDFRTTIEFINQHQQQLAQTEQLIEKAKASSWIRQVEMNEQVKTNLKNIIATLESDDDKKGQS